MVGQQSRTLGDGSELEITHYLLDSDEAESLGRPKGSREVVLALTTGGVSRTTNPQVSAYLGFEELFEIYETIQSRAHYEKVAAVLDSIKSNEDAERIRGSPSGLKGLIVETSAP